MPDGQVFDSTFTPPATLAEVRVWYPGAKIEPEKEPAPAQSAAQVAPPTRRLPAEQPPCKLCCHYRDTDTHGRRLIVSQCAANKTRDAGECWDARGGAL